MDRSFVSMIYRQHRYVLVPRVVHLWHPVARRKSYGLIVDLLCTIVLVAILWNLRANNERQANYKERLFPGLMHDAPRCQSTKFMPFRVGCPSSCVGYRPGATTNETFYRTNLAWYFGEPQAYKQGKYPSAYARGINFQCPLALAENFVKASDDLSRALQGKISSLKMKEQAIIHISLAYLCCLRENETDWVREIMYQWVMDTRPFDFTVRFNELQCWHERSNSVTHIITADGPSQKKILRFYNSLAKRISHFGIPVSVPRQWQMPFHATLVGSQRCDGEGDGSRDCVLSASDLEVMFKESQRLSYSIGSNWTGGEALRIQHEPRFPATARLHTFY